MTEVYLYHVDICTIYICTKLNLVQGCTIIDAPAFLESAGREERELVEEADGSEGLYQPETTKKR
jgi:hypothetical protein